MKIHHLQRAIRRSDLQLTERVLLSALVDLVDWQTWQAETKIKTIEYETGLNRATIARKLNSLEERGFISRTNQTDARGYKESLYTINIKEVETQLSRFFPMSQSATPISQKATSLSQSATPISQKATDRSQSATKRSQSATTNILLSSNSSLPNKDSISFNNSNTEESAQGASLDGDDWEYVKWEDIPIDLPMPKTRWEDHGVHVPTQEEMMRKYK